MTRFERALNTCQEKGVPITEEEFLRIYNLPCEEYCVEEEKMRTKDKYKDAAFTHLFVAYHATYPQKRAEWVKKWQEYDNRRNYV